MDRLSFTDNIPETRPITGQSIIASPELPPVDDKLLRLAAAITDPKLFAKTFLQAELWDVQSDILDAIATRPRVAVKACHASSKCVAASEFITLGEGLRVRASELVGKTFTLPTLDDKGNVILATSRAEFNATEEVFAVTTDSGRQIVRNKHHPLWASRRATKGNGIAASFGVSPVKGTITRGDIVLKEWTPVSELQVGDYIAMTQSLPIFGDNWINEEQLKVLAYLIGDGGLTVATSFTQQDNVQLKEFTNCVETLGGKVTRPSKNWDGVTYNVVGASEEKVRHICSTGSVPHRVNPIINLVRSYGLFGKRSEKKFIPEKIFTLSKKQIAIFLSRLYSMDGYASNYQNEACTIGYSSASEYLIRGIEDLLLKFGIHPYTSCGPASYRNKNGDIVNCLPSWTTTISSFEEVLIFCNEISIYGKEEAIETARKIAEAHHDSRNDSKFGHGPSRNWKKKNAYPGTFWEAIKSIEFRGVEDTVAIEVPDHGTYLTAFWEHNTFSAALITLWFLACFDEAVVVTTAPSFTQVEKLLWGEIHAALSKSLYPFPKANLTELKLGPKRYAYGLSTVVTKQDEGVRFQGIHAKNVLVILDEAPGVNPKIWEAIEGARAGGNVKILALGNPTIASGPFHTAFTEQRSGWKCFTIDAFDTPNLRGINLEQLLDMAQNNPEQLDQNPCPYLVTRRWVVERYYEWGLGHPLWEARVRGQFPKQSADALLSLTWLEEASRRDLPEGEETVAGLDVAGPGEDETSLTIRKGPKVVLHQQWADSDPRGKVVEALNPYKNELKSVNVDCIGIGWGMYRHLNDLKFPALPVNVCEVSTDSEKYADIKSEFYWGLRLRLQTGDFSGLIDEKTIGQLAGIRYSPTPRGQIKIESKEEARKRGVKSPDRAESVMLAFATRIQIYGVLDWAKGVKEQMDKTQLARLMKPAMSDQQLTCPECEATCVVPNNGGWRCNQCGKQFGYKKQAMPGPGRNDLMKMRKVN